MEGTELVGAEFNTVLLADMLVPSSSPSLAVAEQTTTLPLTKKLAARLLVVPTLVPSTVQP